MIYGLLTWVIKHTQIPGMEVHRITESVTSRKRKQVINLKRKFKAKVAGNLNIQ